MRRPAQFALMALVAGALLAAPMASPAAVSAQERERITFRVVLEGPVPETHTFGIGLECSQTCMVDSVYILCSPEDPDWGYVPCAAKTYEFTLDLLVGTHVRYKLVRWTSPNLAGDLAEYHLPGEFTVGETSQVYTLRFVYGGASAAMLPNTAASRP